MSALQRRYTEAEVTAGLMAVVAWAGNCESASKQLKSEGKLDVPSRTLNNWVRISHADRFAELRDKYAEQLEAQLVHEYRDVARLAVDVQKSALEKAQERLEKGDDTDPSRTAANAASVADKMNRNMLSLSGRPTNITEHRSPEEILRSLVAKGVLQLDDGEVVSDSSGPS